MTRAEFAPDQTQSINRTQKIVQPFRRASLARAIAALLLTGCVNQKAEVAKYRSILNADVAGEVPPLEPGEHLTMVCALLLANQDNENLMIRGENFIQAMNDKDRPSPSFFHHLLWPKLHHPR